MFVFDVAARPAETGRPRKKKANLADIQPKKSVRERIRGEKMSNVRVQKVRNILLASAIVGSSLVPTRAFAAASQHDKDRLEANPRGAMVVTVPGVNPKNIQIKPIAGTDGLEIITPNNVPRLMKSDDILKILGLDRFPADVQEIKLGDNAGTRVLLLKEGVISVSFVNAEKGEDEMQVLFSAVKTIKPVNFDAPRVDKDSVFALLNQGPEIIMFDRNTSRLMSTGLIKKLSSLDLSDPQLKLIVDVEIPADRLVVLARDVGAGKLKAVCIFSIDKNGGEIVVASLK